MNFFVIRCGVLWTDAPPACLVRCHGLLSRSRQNNHRHLKQTTTITIITIALINCNALSVSILTLDSIISLAASSPHPLVHLTLGQLFGRLNRWQKKSQPIRRNNFVILLNAISADLWRLPRGARRA